MMNSIINMIRNNVQTLVIILVCAAVLNCASLVLASDVQVRMSSREAYVGSPILLQVTIVDGESPVAPQIPQVDGLEVESAGTPSQRSEVSIINGRYSEKRSLVYTYRLTPVREGTFRIPAFEVDAGDETHQVDALTFVATKSEAGDLLFVEVVGDNDSAYVGESIELSLKIWLKPFVDRDRRVKLSEGDMWNCISEATSWGPFTDRMQELANNGQRPGGEEVLRKDDSGVQRSYYLYQIDAPIYPSRPGQLDMDDVRIVVDYPEKLGISKSPFDRMMRPPGSMFEDSFFGSPFGDRLVVSQQRPIVGEVIVDDTQIIPIPTEGQPENYQGAVGQYEISVSSGNTAVKVGEPIPLQIDIRGTGRLDLLQAPPLDRIQALTKDFRVQTQALAGTTMGPVKYFDTSIRPLNENVKQIPPIPFSFFDPVEEKFKTVYSRPIPIQVSPGEQLSLDSIVAQQQPALGQEQEDRSITIDSLSDWNWFGSAEPDFDNQFSQKTLVAQSAEEPTQWFWWLMAAPPVIWLMGILLGWKHLPGRTWNALRSSEQRFKHRLGTAVNGGDIAESLAAFVMESCESKMSSQTANHKVTTSVLAVGSMRLLGLYQLAATLESFLNRCQDTTSHSSDVSQMRNEAEELSRQIVLELKSSRPTQAVPRTSMATLVRQSAMLVLVCGALALAGNESLRAQDGAPAISAPAISAEAMLREATQIYQAALKEQREMFERSEVQSEEGSGDGAVTPTLTFKRELSLVAPVELQNRFQEAAKKYQWLIDSGISNAALYRSAGNAYAKAGELGRAIMCYEHALKFDPTDSITKANLEATQQEVVNPPATNAGSGWAALTAAVHLGPWPMRLAIGLWLVFWSGMLARQWGAKVPVPLLTLLILFQLTATGLASAPVGQAECVLVNDSVQVFQSDGRSFPVIKELQDCDGWQVPVLEQRGQWIKIRYSTRSEGWIPQTDVGLI